MFDITFVSPYPVPISVIQLCSISQKWFHTPPVFAVQFHHSNQPLVLNFHQSIRFHDCCDIIKTNSYFVFLDLHVTNLL